MHLRPLAPLLLACALPVPSWAFGGGPYPITEFALEGSRQNSDWEFDGQTSRVRTERFGIRWQEALGERLGGGVEFGYLYMRLRDRTPALDPRGYYIGLNLRYSLLARGPHALNLVGSYRYQHADDERDAQRLRISTHGALAGIEGHWAATDQLRIGLGSAWVYLDGEERLRGPVERTADLRHAERFVHRASVEVVTYGPGAVGLEYRTGAEDGWRLYAYRSF